MRPTVLTCLQFSKKKVQFFSPKRGKETMMSIHLQKRKHRRSDSLSLTCWRWWLWIVIHSMQP